MKTLPQISRELSTPIATLRYRLKPYEDFIVGVTTSKGKEYSSESEGIIREINELVVQDNSTETILSILSSKYARDIEIIEESTTAETSQQQNEILLIMKELVNRLDRQDEQQRQIDELRAEVRESRVDRHKNRTIKERIIDFFN